MQNNIRLGLSISHVLSETVNVDKDVAIRRIFWFTLIIVTLSVSLQIVSLHLASPPPMKFAVLFWKTFTKFVAPAVEFERYIIFHDIKCRQIAVCRRGNTRCVLNVPFTVPFPLFHSVYLPWYLNESDLFSNRLINCPHPTFRMRVLNVRWR